MLHMNNTVEYIVFSTYELLLLQTQSTHTCGEALQQGKPSVAYTHNSVDIPFNLKTNKTNTDVVNLTF